MVVVIVTILTFVAYPSLSTFMARDAGLESASFTARLTNRIKGQARQMNRAYVLRFLNFSTNTPQGYVEIREGLSSSCQQIAANVVQNSTVVRRFLYGVDPGPDGNAAINDASEAKPAVGLRGWFAPGDAGADLAGARGGELAICVKPDGAIIDLGTLLPLTGRLRLLVQRFETAGAGAWREAEPPRVVAFTFAGQARLELN